MNDIARLIEIVEPEATALGFALVRVALFGGEDDRTLQVMAERAETRQLNIDDCAALSRRISEQLDALELAGNDPLPGAYRLEVSSPGIDRPLTRLSDFADWQGHEAKVQFKEPVATDSGDRKSLNGTLDGVELGDGGDLGTIAFTDRKSGAVRFAFDNVASAKLVLTDRLIAATRPLDRAGVEEEVTEAPDPHEPDIATEYLTEEQDG